MRSEPPSNKHINTQHNANSSIFLINTSLSPLYQALRKDQSDRVVPQVRVVHGPHRYQELPVSQAHPGTRQEIVSPSVNLFYLLYSL